MISAVQIKIRGYSSTIPANQSLAEGFQAEMLVVLAFCRWYLAFKCASTARSSTGSGDAPERTDDQGRWAEEHEHLQSQGVLLKDEDPVVDGKVEDVALVPQCGQDHHGEERPRLAQPVDLIRIVLLVQPFRAAVVRQPPKEAPDMRTCVARLNRTFVYMPAIGERALSLQCRAHQRWR
jgi:hypothetical protein